MSTSLTLIHPRTEVEDVVKPQKQAAKLAEEVDQLLQDNY